MFSSLLLYDFIFSYLLRSSGVLFSSAFSPFLLSVLCCVFRSRYLYLPFCFLSMFVSCWLFFARASFVTCDVLSCFCCNVCEVFLVLLFLCFRFPFLIVSLSPFLYFSFFHSPRKAQLFRLERDTNSCLDEEGQNTFPTSCKNHTNRISEL